MRTQEYYYEKALGILNLKGRRLTQEEAERVTKTAKDLHYSDFERARAVDTKKHWNIHKADMRREMREKIAALHGVSPDRVVLMAPLEEYRHVEHMKLVRGKAPTYVIKNKGRKNDVYTYEPLKAA
jgi:hypothetical protein